MNEKSIGESSSAGIRESRFLTGETTGSVTVAQKFKIGLSSSEKKPISTLARRRYIKALKNADTVCDTTK